MAQSGTINVASKTTGASMAFSSQARLAPARGRRSLQTMNAVKDVFMPALSSTMTEGKIVSWLKSPGDMVKKGESIVVVESGKNGCKSILSILYMYRYTMCYVLALAGSSVGLIINLSNRMLQTRLIWMLSPSARVSSVLL